MGLKLKLKTLRCKQVLDILHSEHTNSLSYWMFFESKSTTETTNIDYSYAWNYYSWVTLARVNPSKSLKDAMLYRLDFNYKVAHMICYEQNIDLEKKNNISRLKKRCLVHSRKNMVHSKGKTNFPHPSPIEGQKNIPMMMEKALVVGKRSCNPLHCAHHTLTLAEE